MPYLSKLTYKNKVYTLKDTEARAKKVAIPSNDPYGQSGQVLRTNGDGTTEWVNVGLPTEEQTANALSDWLTDHPEAVTTVKNESITLGKLNKDITDSLFDSKDIAWAVESASRPYGWGTGRWSGDIGQEKAAVATTNYARAMLPIGNENYSNEIGDAYALTITPPSGYIVAVRETDATGVVVARYGEGEADQKVSFVYNSSNLYYVTLGGFSSNSGTLVADEDFCSGIKLTARYPVTRDIQQSIEQLKDSLEDTDYEVDQAKNSVAALTEKTNLMDHILMSSEKLNWNDYAPAALTDTGKGSSTVPAYARKGWQMGRWGMSDGVYAFTKQYICLIDPIAPGIAKMTCEVPDGYSVSVVEINSATGAWNASYGASNPENASATTSLTINTQTGYLYRITVGKFGDSKNYIDEASEDNPTGDFVDSVNVQVYRLNSENLKSEINRFKPRTGNFEFFSVTVGRPLAFGGEEVMENGREDTVECVLRLPTSYTTDGKPTRLVLACHGQSGYIKNPNYWYGVVTDENLNWKPFMDYLLAAGYAVFDCNVLPTSYGADYMGKNVGSPLFLNVAKNAYNYIQENYNVYREIFVHGTSMGGVAASAFANAYPSIVLAESSFAGRDLTQYLKLIRDEYYDTSDGEGEDETLVFARPWGYANTQALKDDCFSHAVGMAPSLSLLRYEDVTEDDSASARKCALLYPPERSTSFNDWLDYYSEVQTHNRSDAIGKYTAHRTVPYKAWDSWADDVAKTKAKLILQKAFTAGSSVPYEVVVYDSATHSELSYGKYGTMRDQLIAWYKRWE